MKKNLVQFVYNPFLGSDFGCPTPSLALLVHTYFLSAELAFIIASKNDNIYAAIGAL